jgi:tetratricopeptide (TPR) repeat protein
VLTRDGRAADAKAAYDQALTLDPADADALLSRGELLETMGDPAAATQDYQAALGKRPDFAKAQAKLNTLLGIPTEVAPLQAEPVKVVKRRVNRLTRKVSRKKVRR